jgi:hypothetical protein
MLTGTDLRGSQKYLKTSATGNNNVWEEDDRVLFCNISDRFEQV